MTSHTHTHVVFYCWCASYIVHKQYNSSSCHYSGSWMRATCFFSLALLDAVNPSHAIHHEWILLFLFALVLRHVCVIFLQEEVQSQIINTCISCMCGHQQQYMIICISYCMNIHTCYVYNMASRCDIRSPAVQQLYNNSSRSRTSFERERSLIGA